MRYPNVAAGLDAVLTAFGTTIVCHAVIDTGGHRERRVLLYRLDDDGRDVRAVDADELADATRALFPQDGWRLRPVPRPGTGLDAIRNELGPRLYNQLDREGIATIEELAELAAAVDRVFEQQCRPVRDAQQDGGSPRPARSRGARTLPLQLTNAWPKETPWLSSGGLA